MKLNLPLSLRRHRAKRSRFLADSVAGRTRGKGMSRWRALGREQFRALIAPPSGQDRPEGGSKIC
jgi:hypothetical protein